MQISIAMPWRSSLFQVSSLNSTMKMIVLVNSQCILTMEYAYSKTQQMQWDIPMSLTRVSFSMRIATGLPMRRLVLTSCESYGIQPKVAMQSMISWIISMRSSGISSMLHTRYGVSSEHGHSWLITTVNEGSTPCLAAQRIGSGEGTNPLTPLWWQLRFPIRKTTGQAYQF